MAKENSKTVQYRVDIEVCHSDKITNGSLIILISDVPEVNESLEEVIKAGVVKQFISQIQDKRYVPLFDFGENRGGLPKVIVNLETAESIEISNIEKIA